MDDPIRRVAEKLGVEDHIRRMRLSGISEAEITDFLLDSLVVLIAEVKKDFLGALSHANVASISPSITTTILSDANYFYDS